MPEPFNPFGPGTSVQPVDQGEDPFIRLLREKLTGAYQNPVQQSLTASADARTPLNTSVSQLDPDSIAAQQAQAAQDMSATQLNPHDLAIGKLKGVLAELEHYKKATPAPKGETFAPFKFDDAPVRQEQSYPNRQPPQANPIALALSALAGFANPQAAGGFGAAALNPATEASNVQYQDSVRQHEDALHQSAAIHADELNRFNVRLGVAKENRTEERDVNRVNASMERAYQENQARIGGQIVGAGAEMPSVVAARNQEQQHIEAQGRAAGLSVLPSLLSQSNKEEMAQQELNHAMQLDMLKMNETRIDRMGRLWDSASDRELRRQQFNRTFGMNWSKEQFDQRLEVAKQFLAIQNLGVNQGYLGLERKKVGILQGPQQEAIKAYQMADKDQEVIALKQQLSKMQEGVNQLERADVRNVPDKDKRLIAARRELNLKIQELARKRQAAAALFMSVTNPAAAASTPDPATVPLKEYDPATRTWH